MIGVLASVVGLFVGFGLAKGLDELFKAFGVDLPQTGTVFATRTVIVSLVVGTVVTLLAALRPAVPGDARRRRSRRCARVGPAALAPRALRPDRLVGVCARCRSCSSASARFGSIALEPACGCSLLAVGVLGVVRRGRAGRAEARPGPLACRARRPGAALGGVAGDARARECDAQPGRTASTAAALMIGLALVTLVAVLAPGAEVEFESAVRSSSTPTTRSPRRTASRRRRLDSADALRKSRHRDDRRRRPGRQRRAFRQDDRRHWRRARRLAACSSSSGPRARTHRSRGSARNGASSSTRLREEAPPHGRLDRSARDAGGKMLDLKVDGDLSTRRRAASPFGVDHDLVGGVRLALHEPAERLHVRQHAGRRHATPTRRRSTTCPEDLPGREDPDREAVRRQPGGGNQPLPAPALRPARALDRRLALRDREHARADRLRAHARARHAARGRDDAAADAADDPARVASSRR